MQELHQGIKVYRQKCLLILDNEQNGTIPAEEKMEICYDAAFR